jgi:immune inhibitor A
MTRWRRLSLVLLLLILGACCAEPPSPVASPAPSILPTSLPTLAPTVPPTSVPTSIPTIEPTRLDVLMAEPPSRPFAYTVVNPTPPRRVPNATQSFWVIDGSTGGRREITARLRVQTGHFAMWVEEGVWHDVRRLEEAAGFLETQVYPKTRAVFGTEWTPGVDNDPHIHILHATGLGDGVQGYTTAADEFPRTVYPFSNEAEMITIHMGSVEVGSQAYYGLVSRELQRLIQWYHDRNEERWLKEGLGELSSHLNGGDMARLSHAYLMHPDTSLTNWAGEEMDARLGATYLFAAYYLHRFGDSGTLALVDQPLNGTTGINATMADLGVGLTFETFFADWLVANFVSGMPGSAARHNYAALNQERATPAVTLESFPSSVEQSVHQFGADYILLRGNQDLRVQFSGENATPLLNLEPHSGSSFWWSNRADESLTTLTHSFDLSGVERATLTYWVWYDIEDGYDYATVEVSADGGGQWQMLRTPFGTDANPYGNNPGWGYTGQSAGWVQEAVDLSSYAGSQVLVRFAYLTDEAVTGMGFVLDDIAVPQIDYADDAEEDGGWEAAGFVRTNDRVPQRYMVLLIGIGETVVVERLGIGEAQTATWTVPLGTESWHDAVLVVSGLAPLTTQPAPYRLTIGE